MKFWMSDESLLAQADQALEELLSVKEYAALFQVTPRSVYKALRAQKIPYPVERPLGGAPKMRVPRALVAKLRAA